MSDRDSTALQPGEGQELPKTDLPTGGGTVTCRHSLELGSKLLASMSCFILISYPIDIVSRIFPAVNRRTLAIAGIASIALVVYRICTVCLVHSDTSLTFRNVFKTVKIPVQTVQRIEIPFYFRRRLCHVRVATANGNHTTLVGLGDRELCEEIAQHLLDSPEVWLASSGLTPHYTPWQRFLAFAIPVFSPLLRVTVSASGRTFQVVKQGMKRFVHRLWIEIHPARLARTYLAAVVVAASVVVGIHFLPKSNTPAVEAPSLPQLDVSVDHHNIGMFVDFMDIYDGEYASAYDEEPISNEKGYEVVVGLDIPSAITVRWTVVLDNSSVQPSAGQMSLHEARPRKDNSTPGVSISDEFGNLTITGSQKGPIDQTELLADGLFGIGKHLNQDVQPLQSIQGIELQGSIPGMITSAGDALDVDMPAVVPYENVDESNAGTKTWFPPSTLTSEEDALVGPYSVQTGNATMEGEGDWDWFDNSGGILIAQSSGTNPALESASSRNSLYAGIAFGVAGSAFLAALIEYRRPKRVRRKKFRPTAIDSEV